MPAPRPNSEEIDQLLLNARLRDELDVRDAASAARWSSRALAMRSTWLRPLAGGITAVTPASKRTAPTRLPPRVRMWATVVAISARTRSF